MKKIKGLKKVYERVRIIGLQTGGTSFCGGISDKIVFADCLFCNISITALFDDVSNARNFTDEDATKLFSENGWTITPTVCKKCNEDRPLRGHVMGLRENGSGSPDILSFMISGHIDKHEFCKETYIEFGENYNYCTKLVNHTYARIIPNGEIMFDVDKKRGAFPVTYIDVEQAKRGVV